MSNISSIYKNFFHCHKNTRDDTLRFGSRLLPSSDETTNPKTHFTKTVTHTQHNFVLGLVVSPEEGSSLLPKRGVLFRVFL
jgi:hypothetical protein